MEKYYLVSVHFRNETYCFLIMHRSYLKDEGKDICKIVCEKYKTSIPDAEISYNKEEISDIDYLISPLDKYVLDVTVKIL